MKLIDNILSRCSNLAYHNNLHALKVRQNSMLLMEKVIADGRTVDDEIVELQALSHDLDFHLDHIALGYKTKEDMTANHTFELLIANGIDVSKAMRISDSIRSTNPFVFPSTIEATILRAADMASLASGDYREDFFRLMHENEAKDENAYFLENISYLGFYLWPLFKLTPACFDCRGASDWHTRVLDNIVSHYVELIGGPITIEVGSGSLPIALWGRAADRQGLIIGAEPDQKSREEAVKILKASGKIGVELIVPGVGSAIPLSKSVDRILYPNSLLRCNSFDLDEVNRILSIDGSVSVIETYFPWLSDGKYSTQESINFIDSLLKGFSRTKCLSASEFPCAEIEAFELTYKRSQP